MGGPHTHVLLEVFGDHPVGPGINIQSATGQEEQKQLTEFQSFFSQHFWNISLTFLAFRMFHMVVNNVHACKKNLNVKCKQ